MKPPIPLTDGDWLKLCEKKIPETFGPRSALGKFELAPVSIPPHVDREKNCGRWAVITLKETGDYIVHGCGSTIRRALESAGLGGWCEDVLHGPAPALDRWEVAS